MKRPISTSFRILAGLGAAASVLGIALADTSEGAPVGAWLTTNQCFLAAFLLTEGGRAQAVYLNGEHDDNAVWTWDGSTLHITSRTFDLDRFAGRIEENRILADYVWHDLDKDELHRQDCTFERYQPPGI